MQKPTPNSVRKRFPRYNVRGGNNEENHFVSETFLQGFFALRLHQCIAWPFLICTQVHTNVHTSAWRVGVVVMQKMRFGKVSLKRF